MSRLGRKATLFVPALLVVARVHMFWFSPEHGTPILSVQCRQASARGTVS